MAPLGDFMVRRGGSLSPSAFPDEQFELYSIPAHDRGKPDLVFGSEVGSSKQLVQPGDVMISKIVPHIRRSRVVGSRSDNRQIASGEWIVFRTNRFDPSFLRHYLMSDYFHLQFMRTVAGVGGSLLRARPSEVSKLAMPMPPIEEQRRIAAILDQTDTIRAKRRQVLTGLDALTQAAFVDVIKSACHRNSMRLEDAYWFQEGPGIRKWQFTDTGVKLLNVGNIERDGSINLEKTSRHISVGEAAGRYSHFLADEGDLVIASSGISFDTDGLLRTRGAFIEPAHLPLCMNTSTIRFKAVPGVSTLRYLQAWLSSTEFRTQITRLVTGSAQQNFGPTHLKQVLINLPEMPAQMRFARLAEYVAKQRTKTQHALGNVDALLASLQARAFSGWP